MKTARGNVIEFVNAFNIEKQTMRRDLRRGSKPYDHFGELSQPLSMTRLLELEESDNPPGNNIKVSSPSSTEHLEITSSRRQLQAEGRV